MAGFQLWDLGAQMLTISIITESSISEGKMLLGHSIQGAGKVWESSVLMEPPIQHRVMIHAWQCDRPPWALWHVIHVESIRNPKRDFTCGHQERGLPRWLSSKESAGNAEDPALIPRSGRSPGEGNGNPLQYSGLKITMDRGAWQATVHGVTGVGHDLATKLLIL